jgi:hypothetical protein
MRDRIKFIFNGTEVYMDASRSARDIVGRIAALCREVNASPAGIIVMIASGPRWRKASRGGSGERS